MLFRMGSLLLRKFYALFIGVLDVLNILLDYWRSCWFTVCDKKALLAVMSDVLLEADLEIELDRPRVLLMYISFSFLERDLPPYSI